MGTLRRATLVALVVVVVAAAGWLWSRQTPDRGQGESQQAAPAGSATPSPTLRPTPAAPARRPQCPARVAQPFDPVTIAIAGVAGRRAVVTPPRDAAGVPGIPALTSAGKPVFAWDREQGIRPGDERGNVLLNAHTWPDGSALGNDLLRTLDRGDRIVVRGSSAALCYRVTEKVEVSAAQGLPRYYESDGPPRLAIVVCSGRRLGPGQWENRTIWFASPRT